MKKFLIVLLIISGGFNVYLIAQNNTEPSFETTLAERSDLGIFQREDNMWNFYSIKDDGSKEPTGLSVSVQSNPSVDGWPEEIYASLSPNGKKIAYMQKPTWPHQIYVANIDGTNAVELVKWDASFTPTHAQIENQFTWSPNGDALLYAITNENCNPDDNEGTLETTLFEKNLVSEKEETILHLEHKCDEFNLGAKAILVASYPPPIEKQDKREMGVNLFSGSWFNIEYPSNFITRPAISEKQTSVQTDEAYFTSPDEAVEFFVYSPLWSGDPQTYLTIAKTEALVSEKIEEIKESEQPGQFGDKVVRWVTVKALDDSYYRSFVSIKEQVGTGSDLHHVFGIKYNDSASYDEYNEAYLAFKESLQQLAD